MLFCAIYCYFGVVGDTTVLLYFIAEANNKRPLLSDVNHEMDVRLHGLGVHPLYSWSCTKIHCHERALYFNFTLHSPLPIYSLLSNKQAYLMSLKHVFVANSMLNVPYLTCLFSPFSPVLASPVLASPVLASSQRNKA